MVLKLSELLSAPSFPFENDVKMYGTQTSDKDIYTDTWFENDVKMYGTQTVTRREASEGLFENDVKMYGTQTLPVAV